ncbi:hypothetical protein A3J15_00675 [Candidatus Roizmanbacteria bacterium RIFCSPLOWO2_02_FULL_38_10]|uniref:Glycosyltransferase RgtA/B/C/D-like domain-containing protein n=1 Tax=Candidatus Roizmanbacteria bacterium RIFCSPLOWO2_02_FULL_38_10 TaxID=1802074 RepID=A0A1F7JMQ7_9BACT|nr:MAG: hypothetical protein A3J15_00675 [Candidatus Roizmanbacteria bacterium RIFCSPLOWO2_02_FULL_38_10]
MIKKIQAYFNKNKFQKTEIIILCITLLIFIINSQYVTYPDEFVNLLGGQAILQGKIPYSDFFDNHMPFAWYLSALVIKLSTSSYVFFRFLWSMLQLLSLTILGFWIKTKNQRLYKYYLGFLTIYPLTTIYFWLHLYLADSLAALLFSLIFWILLTLTFNHKADKKILYVCSFLTFCLVFSSLTYLYLSATFYLWQFYLMLKSNHNKKTVLYFIMFAITPYTLYLIYLLLTRSLNNFIFANFTYNINQYIGIPNYTRGHFFNPLKFALALIFNFWHEYIPLLARIKDLSLNLPILTLSALSGLIMLVLMTFTSVIPGIIFFLLMSFTAPRSGMQSANETDYQMGVFLMFGLISTFAAIYWLRENKYRDELLNDLKRICLLLLTFFLLFTYLFLAKNTYEKWYLRYSQAMPSIYNLAPSASFIDEILDVKDHYWIGPFDPQEIFFVKKAQLAGKYPALLPQYKENDALRQDFMSQIKRYSPTVIIFKTDMGIFMNPAEKFADFLINWMSDKYTLLEKVPKTRILKSPSSFTLGHHLYIRNDKLQFILQKMQHYGYIERL